MVPKSENYYSEDSKILNNSSDLEESGEELEEEY